MVASAAPVNSTKIRMATTTATTACGDLRENQVHRIASATRRCMLTALPHALSSAGQIEGVRRAPESASALWRRLTCILSTTARSVSYTHLRAHETPEHL